MKTNVHWLEFIEKEVFVAGRGTRERISGVRIRCRGFFVKSALDIAEGGGVAE